MVRKAGSNVLATHHKLKSAALAKKNKGLLHMKQLKKYTIYYILYIYHILFFNLEDRFGEG